MNVSDKIKMTINIGGEHIQLTIPFDRQDAVRDAESAAARLYDTWRLKWPKTSDKEILARVAYQFAYYFNDLSKRYEAATQLAEETEAMIDSVLSADNTDDVK